jgi:hypothetical protein
MGRWRTAWIVGVGLAALLLAACRGQGHMEGSLTYPPPRPPPGQAPLPQPSPRGEPQGLPRGLAPLPGAPPGIYFLHEQDFGVGACVFIGERSTGGAGPAIGGDEESARARAVLDMAEEARWMGGNVVLLPSFREDYRSGHLQGRVYRCGEPERRSIYDRAAAEHKLTVIQP